MTISNSFRASEVEVFCSIFEKCHHGGDVKQLLRSSAATSLQAKFLSMRDKIREEAVEKERRSL